MVDGGKTDFLGGAIFLELFSQHLATSDDGTVAGKGDWVLTKAC